MDTKTAEPETLTPTIECGECGATFSSKSEDARHRWAERHMRLHWGTRAK